MKPEPAKSREYSAERYMNPSEKRWWGLTRFEWTMSVLTFAGLVIAVFTGLIFLKQLHEMRTDQRAWISISPNGPQFPKDEASISTTNVVVPVTINNIGKTAARTLSTRFAMEYIVQGDSPDFAYRGFTDVRNSTGIMFPNAPLQVNVPFVKVKFPTTEVEPRFLLPSEYRDLSNGSAYMVVYAESTYLDIFGTEHWLHFCEWFVAPGAVTRVSSKACTAYNDTDSN